MQAARAELLLFPERKVIKDNYFVDLTNCYLEPTKPNAPPRGGKKKQVNWGKMNYKQVC